MKKLLFLTIISGIILAGCNPNEELYDELDKVTSDAYTDQLEYTLSESDYSTIADLALADAQTPEDSSRIENIDDYYAFADEFKAADYVPAFLANKYVALDEGSVINVTYNYLGSVEILNMLAQYEYYTLQYYDYNSMGEGDGEPGEYDNFAYYMDVESYLSDFLAEKYPDAEEGFQVAVTYDYYDNGVSEKTDFYSYEDGTWQAGEAPVSNIYLMTEDDYASIGGNVANYGNFSEDDPPNKYLPVFLNQKFPYAEQGDEKYVVYDYYGGDSPMKASKYYFDGETWKPYQKQSNQFIYGSEGWAFDPTVRFTMVNSDYQLIVDERASSYVDSYGTYEAYSGASGFYGNFEMRKDTRAELAPEFADMGTEEAEDLMWERILHMADEPMETRGALIVMLQNKYPDAVPEQNGIPVRYEVTFDMYYGGGNAPTYTAIYECTASGDPASFEFVETDAPYSE